jgi:hypothetical protein
MQYALQVEARLKQNQTYSDTQSAAVVLASVLAATTLHHPTGKRGSTAG